MCSKLCNHFKNEQPVTHFCDTNFCWDVDDDATAKPTNQRPARVAVTSLYLFRTGHKSSVRRWNTVRREAAGVITRDCYTAGDRPAISRPLLLPVALTQQINYFSRPPIPSPEVLLESYASVYVSGWLWWPLGGRLFRCRALRLLAKLPVDTLR